jgi:xanthine dehydrogenase YagR molybdenum-binding subunit
MPRIIKQKIEFEGRIEEQQVILEGDDLPPWPAQASFSIVGKPVPRVDGKDRVGGAARYTADLYPTGVLHGGMLRSPHAHARIAAINTEKAARAPGVRAVFHAGNAPRIPWHNKRSWLFDPELRYVGDEVAAVIAESQEAARDALELIDVEYEVLPHVIDAEEALAQRILVHPAGNLFGGAPERYARGDVDQGLAQADTMVSLTIRTPDALHHCMETHGSVAEWSGDQLTLWDSTQYIFAVRQRVAACLGIPLDKVRVLSPFMGGGFGAKIDAGKYTVLAALAARQTGCPVRFFLSRAEESQAAGERPKSLQKIRVGALRDGLLTGIDYWGLSDVGAYRGMATPLSGPAQELYACPNVRTEIVSVFTHTSPGAAFRAPGYVEATVALECAIEALADRLAMDPMTLRLRNHAAADQVQNRPYSCKYLREAYELGARAIGWERRLPTPARPRPDGAKRRGFGMASQMWGGAGAPPAYAQVRLNLDGTAEIRIGTQDIGTGAKTALAQIAAEVLTLPIEQVRLSLGDTDFPYSPISGGSMTIASCGPAVRMAAEDVRRQLLDVAASMLEAAPSDIRLESGAIQIVGVPDKKMSVRDITTRMGSFSLMGHGFRGANAGDVTIRTFGAQFAEVEVDTSTGEIEVIKIAACHDVGRIINPLQYASQIEGGVIQGLGFALREEHATDPETGSALDLGFDGYAVPRQVVIPSIDSMAVGIPDPLANNLGVKGVGEPPIIPTAAAIANAVANALGVSITDLPITPMKVVAAVLESGEKEGEG